MAVWITPSAKALAKFGTKPDTSARIVLRSNRVSKVEPLKEETRPSTLSADAEVRSGQSAKLIGDIVEKKSRGRGKPFFACTRFPDCTFVMNARPESQQQLEEAYKNWKENPPKPKKKFAKKKTSE